MTRELWLRASSATLGGVERLRVDYQANLFC